MGPLKKTKKCILGQFLSNLFIKNIFKILNFFYKLQKSTWRQLLVRDCLFNQTFYFQILEKAI